MSTVQTNRGWLNVSASLSEFAGALRRAWLTATSQTWNILHVREHSARQSAERMQDTIDDRPVTAFERLAHLGDLGRDHIEPLSNHGMTAAEFLRRMHVRGGLSLGILA
jgi:hypothetical protein